MVSPADSGAYLKVLVEGNESRRGKREPEEVGEWIPEPELEWIVNANLNKLLRSVPETVKRQQRKHNSYYEGVP